MRHMIWISLMLLSACIPDKDVDSGGGVTESPDSDGDGVLDYLDCAPLDPATLPGAPEVCDATDNDCDGEVDEEAIDAVSWYADEDGDGYGVDAYLTLACTAPVASSSVGGDCDDADGHVSPVAEERCGGGDEDCDGQTDEADAADQETFYADNDGDGYGDEAVAFEACEAPDGFVDDDADCDDLDAALHPDATELCDGVDQDCDGIIDERATDLVWHHDIDHDGYGTGASISDCMLADPSYSLVDGDCDDHDATSWPGAEELCDGADNDCDGVVDDEVDDMPVWYPDRDGDGYGEESGAPYATCGAHAGYVADASDCDDAASAVSPEAVELCADGLDNDCDGALDSCAPTALYGAGAGDYLGWATLAGQDWSGDGVPDALFSGYLSNGAGSDAGRIYLVSSAVASDLDLSAAAVLDGSKGLELGAGLADPGDLNGDGYADLLAGGSGDASGGEDAGSVWLIAGPLADGATIEDRLAVVRGAAAGDALGGALAAGGDLDGDGLGDWAAGSYLSSLSAAGAGAVWSYSTGWSGDEVAGASASARLLGVAAGDGAGRALDLDGDVDGDGLADLVVGAPTADGLGDKSNSGCVYVLYGPVTDDISLADSDRIVIGDDYSQAGYALDLAGDLDGDGRDDLIVGARHDDLGGDDAGGMALLLGPVEVDAMGDAAMTWAGDSAGDDAGSSVRAAGDVDGDGSVDLIFGGPGDADGGADAGAVWLVYGPALAGDVGFKVSGEVAGGALGMRAGAAADLSGDGLFDLLLGAPKASSALSKSGSILFVTGF